MNNGLWQGFMTDAVGSGQRAAGSGQRAAGSGQRAAGSGQEGNAYKY